MLFNGHEGIFEMTLGDLKLKKMLLAILNNSLDLSNPANMRTMISIRDVTRAGVIGEGGGKHNVML